MPDKDALKAKSEVARQERDRFELTRKGQAEEVGIIPTNAAPAGEFSLKEKNDKKRDDFVNLLLMLDAWQATMDDLQAQMQAVLDKAAESLERINRMHELQQDWDFKEAQAFYSEAYNQDISRMSDGAAYDLLSTTMDRETMDYATYMIEAGKIEQQMKVHFEDPAFLAASPDQQQDFRDRYHKSSLNRMSELNTKAAELGIIIEEATSRLTEGHSWNSQLFQDTDSAVSTNEYEAYNSNPVMNEESPFADLAPDLAKSFNEATLSKPSDDPAVKELTKEQANHAVITAKL